MKKLIAFSLWFIVLSLPLFAQETFTLVTYYPAPFGVYNELRSRRVVIGPDYYDPSRYPQFVDDGIEKTNEIGRYADLVVQRYVGIGTFNPLYELHIKERPMAGENAGGNPNRPRIVLEDVNTIGTTSDPYRFVISLKSPRTDNRYGLNLYFPLYDGDTDNGMFMQVDDDQAVRFLGNVSIKEPAGGIPASLSIGSYSASRNLRLDVEGAIGAQLFCDADGNNCVRPPFGGVVATPEPNRNCKWRKAVSPNDHIQCSAGEVMAGIQFETSNWSRDDDSHAAPEVPAILCCTLEVGVIPENYPVPKKALNLSNPTNYPYTLQNFPEE